MWRAMTNGRVGGGRGRGQHADRLRAVEAAIADAGLPVGLHRRGCVAGALNLDAPFPLPWSPGRRRVRKGFGMTPCAQSSGATEQSQVALSVKDARVQEAVSAGSLWVVEWGGHVRPHFACPPAAGQQTGPWMVEPDSAKPRLERPPALLPGSTAAH